MIGGVELMSWKVGVEQDLKQGLCLLALLVDKVLKDLSIFFHQVPAWMEWPELFCL